MALDGVKKILIVNLGGMGDVFLSLPAVRAIRAAYPDVRIDAVVFDRVAELARDAGLFAHVSVWPACPLRDLLLTMRLRRERYDLAVNMRTMVSAASALKMRALFALIAPKKSAGRDTDGHGSFFDITIPETRRGLVHEIEYDVAMAAALGAPVDDAELSVTIGEAAEGAVTRLLAETGIGADDRIVGIHAGGPPSHRWPRECFAEVIAALAQEKKRVFVLTGSAAEREYLEPLAGVAGATVLNLAGRLSLKELCALISRCDLYISNDTGPLHFAAALDVPLVGIFGPGYLIRFDPRYISDKAVVVQGHAPCAPCDRLVCASRECLLRIPAARVIEAAQKGLRVHSRERI